ncbi:MAG: hypothetical protein AB8I08_38195, partial [Sandaracinaceae bacterium]
MSAPARKQYDHRIRNAIVEAGNPDLFPGLAIPDSTGRSWLARGVSEVVTLDARDTEIVALYAEVARLEKRAAVLATVVRLLVTLVRVSGATLAGVRVPGASGKRRVLHAVARAEAAIGRSAALRIVGLTPARAGAWSRRERACALDDAPPCPPTVSGRLTRDERGAIRDLVEAEQYKHLSLRSLALLGKRAGKVFASYETWSRLVR